MVEIFHYALEGHILIAGATPYYRKLHAIASVSTAWRNIITGTPSFWTRVEISDGDASYPLDLAMRRAKDMLLDVSFDIAFRLSETVDEDIESGETRRGAAVQHLARWQSVSLVTRHPGTAQTILSVSAINVKRVHVNFEWERQIGLWLGPPVTLLAGHAVGLEEVRIQGMPFSWETMKWGHLRALDLREIRGTGGVPRIRISDILEALGSNRKLEELSLIQLVLEIGSDSLEVEEGSIALTKLKYLTLEHIGAIAIHSILRSITAPSLSHFSVVHISSFEPMSSVPAIFSPQSQSLQVIILQTTGFELSLSGERFCLVGTDSENTIVFQLELTLAPDEHPGFLLWLKHHLPLPKDPKRMDISLNNYPDAIWGSKDVLFRWAHSATSLTIGQDCDTDVMLRRLSKRPGKDESSWVWPNLQELYITDERTTTKSVLALLRGRYETLNKHLQQQATSSEQKGPRKPQKLSRLHIDVVDVRYRATLDRIRQAVGDDQVTWSRTIGGTQSGSLEDSLIKPAIWSMKR
ncbi:hypothetical protein FRB90_009499 [Tulasnella sp. 427]|nr:hypothetical protein FRB90_009499 [Tulasnella sp. 427]